MATMTVTQAAAPSPTTSPPTATTPTATGTGRSGILIKTKGSENLPMHGGTVDSSNWSGYAVTPTSGGITAVKSSFRVPTASPAPPGFAATWTGIGGYSSTDLIQAGVSEGSAPSNPLLGDQYYAWYELLPDASVQITSCSGNASCPVSPGDQVTVSISRVSSGLWAISIADPAEGWTWAKRVAYASSESSAEWILESPSVDGLPSLTLPAVGTVAFGPTSTYGNKGATHTVAQGNPTTIDLSLAGVANEAIPSAIASNGQSFNVCAYALSCPTP